MPVSARLLRLYRGRCALSAKERADESNIRCEHFKQVRRHRKTHRKSKTVFDGDRSTTFDRFDGSLEDVFELQDQVALSVAGVIEPALQAAKIRRATARPTSDLTAYDLYLRSIELARAWSREANLPTCWSGRSSAIRATVSPSRGRRFVIRKSSSRAGPRIPSRADTRA
jgi:hypothetical protein